jgi:hypothetical protein
MWRQEQLCPTSGWPKNTGLEVALGGLGDNEVIKFSAFFYSLLQSF